MAFTLVPVTKNTRGLNSREITYMAVGKYETKTVERESKPLFKEDGSPDLDEKGNQKREPLGKDAEGKQLTFKEEVKEFKTDGVLTDVGDAMELVNGDEQVFLDCFVEGFNARQYELEASKDELDEIFRSLNASEDVLKTLKRAANAVAKALGMSNTEGAELVKSKYEAKLAAATASA